MWMWNGIYTNEHTHERIIVLRVFEVELNLCPAHVTHHCAICMMMYRWCWGDIRHNLHTFGLIWNGTVNLFWLHLFTFIQFKSSNHCVLRLLSLSLSLSWVKVPFFCSIYSVFVLRFSGTRTVGVLALIILLLQRTKHQLLFSSHSFHFNGIDIIFMLFTCGH